MGQGATIPHEKRQAFLWWLFLIPLAGIIGAIVWLNTGETVRPGPWVEVPDGGSTLTMLAVGLAILIWRRRTTILRVDLVKY